MVTGIFDVIDDSIDVASHIVAMALLLRQRRCDARDTMQDAWLFSVYEVRRVAYSMSKPLVS